MKKAINIIKSIPWYGWILSIGLFLLQYFLYLLAPIISNALGLTPLCPKIDKLDNLIPQVKIFVIPYVFSYVFWICGNLAISITSKDNFINYIISLVFAYLIGFLIFIFFPTYISRVDEGLYKTLGNDLLSNILKIVYDNDGKEVGLNLFPSYHCLISTYCYLGIRKQKNINKKFKIYTIIMTALICLSTLFTKQHYFLDMICGISISIFTYSVVKLINPANKLIEKTNQEMKGTL